MLCGDAILQPPCSLCHCPFGCTHIGYRHPVRHSSAYATWSNALQCVSKHNRPTSDDVAGACEAGKAGCHASRAGRATCCSALKTGYSTSTADQSYACSGLAKLLCSLTTIIILCHALQGHQPHTCLLCVAAQSAWHLCTRS